MKLNLLPQSRGGGGGRRLKCKMSREWWERLYLWPEWAEIKSVFVSSFQKWEEDPTQCRRLRTLSLNDSDGNWWIYVPRWVKDRCDDTKNRNWQTSVGQSSGFQFSSSIYQLYRIKWKALMVKKQWPSPPGGWLQERLCAPPPPCSQMGQQNTSNQFLQRQFLCVHVSVCTKRASRRLGKGRLDTQPHQTGNISQKPFKIMWFEIVECF